VLLCHVLDIKLNGRDLNINNLMIQLNLENNGNNVVHLSAQREVTKQVGNPTTKIEPKLQDLNFWNYIMSNIRTTPCKYTTLIALINVRGQICFEIFVSFYC
jgi:hypothetical protein